MPIRYYMNRGSVKAMMVGFTPGVLIIAVSIFGLNSLLDFIISVLVGIAALVALWFGLTRGTSITIDKDNNLYSTFLFFKGDVVSLSSIVSLEARHPLLLGGKITKVWNTYRDKRGKLMTKSLISRQVLKPTDFNDLIERIRRGSSTIEIPSELLK